MQVFVIISVEFNKAVLDMKGLIPLAKFMNWEY